MVAPIRYLSRREISKELGVTDYSEDRKTLEVIGKVGIGTTVFDVDPGAKLQVNGSIFMRGDVASQLSDGRTGIEIGAGSPLTGVGTAHHRIRSAGGSGQNLMFEAQTADVFAPGGDIVFKTGGTNDRLRILKDGNIGIGVRTPTAKLTINPLTTLPVDGTVTPTSTTQKAIGGVSIANSENKIYPSSNFNATLGLYQENEIGGITTYASGNEFIYGSRNVLVKRNDNTQDIRALNFTGSETRVTWTDQNTAQQIIGERSTIEYLGADANGRTSSYLVADNVFLRPADGATQTINNVVSSNNVIINPKAGINTVNITNLLGVRPALPYVFNFGSGTHDVNITDLVIYDTINDWGTIGSVGTVTVDIDNYYGLRLLEPTDTSNLTFNNNYGVYSGWSESKNYFAGNVGIGSTQPTAKLDVVGITKTEQLNVTGVSTFQSDIEIYRTTGSPRSIKFYDNSSTFQGSIFQAGSRLEVEGTNELALTSNLDIEILDHTWRTERAIFKDNGAVELYYPGPVTTPGVPGAGVKRFETTGYGVTVFGTTESQQLNVSGLSTFQGDVRITDDDKLRFGTSSGGILQIYTNGNNSFFKQTSGDLKYELADQFIVQKDSGDEPIAIFNSDSDVELYYDGSKKFETTGYGVTVFGTTQTQQLNVSGVSTFQGNINLGDNDQIIIGDGPDLKLYHDGSNSYVEDTGVGALIMKGSTIRFRSTTNENIINASQNGSVNLYYDNSNKFETTSTGVSISNGNSDTATIAAPSNLIIDPAVVGDNTGIVRIKGDLFVDGATTQINSTTLEIADFIVGIASTATTDLLADGAGIQIGPDNTLLYKHNGGTNPSLKSSENLNVASGKGYQINQTEVLNATTLGSGVTNSSLTSVGTLSSLNVSGVSTFQSHVHLGDDDELRFGASNDFKIVHDPNDCRFENSNGDIKFKNTGSYFFFDEDGGETLASFINDGAVNLFHDNSKKFETTSFGVKSIGNIDLTSELNFTGANNKYIDFFTDNDSGSTYAANLRLVNNAANSFHTAVKMHRGGAVELYHNNSKKFETTGYGVTVFGTTETQQLNVSGVSTFQGNLDLGDDNRLRLGDGNDLKLWHNGSNSIINDEGVGDLYLGGNSSVNITNAALSEFKAKFITDGAVELYYDNSKKFETTDSGIDVTGHTETDTLNVSGVSTFKDKVHLLDDDKLHFGGAEGDDGDLQIYHDGIHSNIVDVGTGNLILDSNGSGVVIKKFGTAENMARFLTDGAVELHYDNSKKFETTASGIDVTGHTETDTLNVSGISTIAGTLTVGNSPFVTSPGHRLRDVGHLVTRRDGAKAPVYSVYDGELFLANIKIQFENDGSAFFMNSVGIGTTNPNSAVSLSNNRILHTGIVTANFYYGDGSNLTGINASQVGALTDIVFDTTPQLGGNLDLNGKDITGTGNIDITGNLKVSGVSTFSDNVSIASTNVAALTITPPSNFPVEDFIGGVSIANTENKTYPTNSGFFVGLGLNQNIEVGGTQVINPSTPGGFNYISGIRNILTKDNDNTQDIERSHYYGIEQRFNWNDQNTCKQYIGILDIFTYLGIDANGRTSNSFDVDRIMLAPPEGGQQTIANVNSKNVNIRGLAATGISTVAITDVAGHSPNLSFQNFVTGTHNNSITNYSAFRTNQYWGTQGTTGTLNATITNYYGLHLNAPINSTGLTITNNYGVYSGWSESKNYFAGNVGIRTDDPTSTLHISGVGSTVNVGISTVELMVPNGAPKVRIGTHHWDEIFSTFHAKDVTSEFWIEQNSDNNDGPDMVFFKSRGVPGTELPVQIGDNLARIGVRGLSTSTTASGVGITLTDYPATASGLEWYVDHISDSGVPSASFNVLGRGSRRLTVASGGKVGIGTTLPQTSLHIHQNAPIIRLTDKNQSTDNRSWNIAANASQVLRIQAINDAGSGGGQAFDFYRSGTQVQKFLGRNGSSYWFAIDNSSRRVGIGTTVPAVPLDIRNTQPTLRLYDTDATNAYTNITNINGNMYLGARNDSNDGVLLFGGYGGGTFNEFFRASSNGFIVRTNGDERLRVASTGNVGVGNTTPEYKLHVEGDIKLADTGTLWFSDTTDSVEKIEATASTINLHADSEVRFFESDTGTEKVSVDVNNSRIFFNGDDDTYWHRPAANTHEFVTAGSERVRIDSSGRLLVGVSTSSANTKFLVQGGTISDNANLFLARSNAPSGTSTGSKELGSIAFSANNHAASAVILAERDGGTWTNGVSQPTRLVFSSTADGSSSPTERVRITSAGNVGIGTDNPTTKLEIAGTGAPTIRVRDLDGTNQFGQILANNGTFVIESRNDTSTGRIMFRGRDASGTNEYARFNSNGDLGIGTISPSAAADTNNTAILNVGVVTANFYYGNGSNLTGLTAGVVGALAGLTIRKEGSARGGIGSVGDINFVSSNLSATASGVGATITLSDTPSFTKIGIGTDVLDASLQINVGSAVTALDIQGSEGQLFSVTNNLTSGSIFSVNDVSGIPSIDVDANGTILLAPYGINENVGVGTTNPSEKLDVIGTVKATDFNTTSDQNLKTNIHKIENPLEKVVEIRGVNFEWKQNNKSSAGVIAQEVEKVLPELVTDSGTKTVNYNGLIGLLIEVVKEQQEQINSLNSRLSKLE